MMKQATAAIAFLLAALGLAMAAGEGAAADKRKPNPASHEPALLEELLTGRAYVYAKPHNRDETFDESARVSGIFLGADGKARICTRTQGSTRQITLDWKVLPSEKHRAVLALTKGRDDPEDARFQQVPVYDAESGDMRLDRWDSRSRRWIVWTRGWVQEGWPKVLADRCGKLELPDDVAVNEVQTEKRIGRLRDQDPEAAILGFSG